MATKQSVDLDSMTASELSALINAAQEKRAAKMEEAKAALLAEFRTRSAELGISLDELRDSSTPTPAGRKARKDAGTTPSPKYRSPDGATWSGRGRKPQWLHAAEAEGKSASDYLIVNDNR